MIKTPDITVVGGGVIGLLTAREFVNAGATVTLIDKGLLGQESSWAGGGILLPLYPWRQAEAISTLVLQSLHLYPTLAAHLIEGTGKDPEWTPCGLLITKNPDFDTAIDWCQRHQIRFETASAHFFNILNTHAEQPLWLPDIAQARNPRLVKSLIQDLHNKGVTLQEHCELTDLTLVNNHITHLNTSRGSLPVKQLIISAGAWTGSLFKQLFPEMLTYAPQVAPVKGQMLLFDAPPNTLQTMVLDGDQYLIPRRDGKPALNKAPLLHHWAGLRPGTEQGIPYIDRHPSIANLSINAGHFRNGLVMGPASAQLMVDLLLNRPTAVDPRPYQLNRDGKSCAN